MQVQALMLALLPVIPGAISAATIYRARVGMCRAFHHPSDALDYERGHSYFPAHCSAEIGTPEHMGWCDARDAASAAAMDETAEWANKHQFDGATQQPKEPHE